MIILTIRTDKPEAEIGLYDDHNQLSYKTWLAHRQLAESLHNVIKLQLEDSNLSWSSINAIVCFKGPGSFTGLRIGLSVGNALAYGLGVPIVASSGNWIEIAIKRLINHESDPVALPDYGSDVHISLPRK